MKNLRDSANIVRSMARQYQAVIDLAEHVGEGDKLEKDIAHLQERVAQEKDNLQAAQGKTKYAEDRLGIMNKRIMEKQEEMDKAAGANAEKISAHEVHLRDIQNTTAQAEKNMVQKIKLLDNAQGQLLDLQGTINEKKDELSRLENKIAAVQAAISKVA